MNLKTGPPPLPSSLLRVWVQQHNATKLQHGHSACQRARMAKVELRVPTSTSLLCWQCSKKSMGKLTLPTGRPAGTKTLPINTRQNTSQLNTSHEHKTLHSQTLPINTRQNTSQLNTSKTLHSQTLPINTKHFTAKHFPSTQDKTLHSQTLPINTRQNTSQLNTSHQHKTKHFTAKHFPSTQDKHFTAKHFPSTQDKTLHSQTFPINTRQNTSQPNISHQHKTKHFTAKHFPSTQDKTLPINTSFSSSHSLGVAKGQQLKARR